MDEATIEGRLALLRSAPRSEFWSAVRESLREEIQEVRSVVENLSVGGDELQRARVRLDVLKDLESGEFLRKAMENLKRPLKGPR